MEDDEDSNPLFGKTWDIARAMARRYAFDKTNAPLMRSLKEDAGWQSESMVQILLDRSNKINKKKSPCNHRMLYSLGSEGMLLKQYACVKIRNKVVIAATEALIAKMLEELELNGGKDDNPVSYDALEKLQSAWEDHVSDFENAMRIWCSLLHYVDPDTWMRHMDVMCSNLVKQKGQIKLQQAMDLAEVEKLIRQDNVQALLEQESLKEEKTSTPKKKKHKLNVIPKRSGGIYKGNGRGCGRARGRGVRSEKVTLQNGTARVEGRCDKDTQKLECGNARCWFKHPWRDSQ